MSQHSNDFDCNIAIYINKVVTMFLPGQFLVDIQVRLVSDRSVDVVRDEGAELKLDN